MKQFLLLFLCSFAALTTGRANAFLPEKIEVGIAADCFAPTDLAAVDITTNSAKVQWTAAVGASSYVLQYRPTGTDTWKTITITGSAGTPVSTFYVIGNLNSNTNYQWRVRTICSSNSESDYAEIHNFTTLGNNAVCLKPEGLSVTDVTTTSAILHWNAVAGAISYEVNLRKVADTIWQNFPVNTNSFVAQNLVPNSGYVWRVRSLCANNPGTVTYSDWSVLSDFHTLANPVACAKPVDLVSYDITTTTAHFKWGAVAGALGYEFQWALCGTNDWHTATITGQNGAAPVASFALDGLTPNTCYIWRVRAKCDGSVFSDWSDVKEFHTLNNSATCDHPSGLTTNDITATSALLKWNAVSGALGYEIQWKTCDAAAAWVSVLVNTNQFTLGNLAPATCYLWKVRAKCDGSIFSDWSAEIEFHTLNNTVTCGHPFDLATYDISQNSANIKWSAVTGAIGYEIQWRACNSTVWQTATTTNTNFFLGNLNPATCYVWQVRAHCDGGLLGDWSAIQEFHTLGSPQPCNPPMGLEAHDITAHSAILTWAAVAGAVGYEIQIRKVGSTDWAVYQTTVNKFLIQNLMADSDYEWRVRTKCASTSAGSVSYSDWSEIDSFSTLPEPPPPAPCLAPDDFNADSITHFSAKFTWNATPGAFSYILYIRPIGTANWQQIVVSGTPVPTSKWVYNLLPNTDYEAQIQAKCGPNSVSDFSDLIEFTTLEAPVCLAPTDLAVSNITYSSANLSWSAVPGAVGYRVRYRKVGTSAWTNKIINGNPPATTTVASPLPANSLIEWQVRTFCGTGSESDWSDLNTFMTPPAPPCSIPTGLSVQNLTAHTATFIWTASNGAVSYRVRYRKVNTVAWKVKVINGNPPATSVNVTGLAANTYYEVQVKATCGPGSESAYSASVLFQTPPQFGGGNGGSEFLTKTASNSVAELAVWPNPTSDLMNISVLSLVENEVEIQLFDLNGRAVKTTQLAVNEGVNELAWSVSDLPSGLYLLRVQGGDVLLTRKVLVEKR